MKFMAASAEHAEDMSRLIFTILKKAENVSVEQTILSGFPDLLVRHPNIMEPWTSDVFDKLEDEDDDVRASTLTMISDLIVKDLVKVGRLLTLEMRRTPINKNVATPLPPRLLNPLIGIFSSRLLCKMTSPL